MSGYQLTWGFVTIGVCSVSQLVSQSMTESSLKQKSSTLRALFLPREYLVMTYRCCPVYFATPSWASVSLPSSVLFLQLNCRKAGQTGISSFPGQVLRACRFRRCIRMRPSQSHSHGGCFPPLPPMQSSRSSIPTLIGLQEHSQINLIPGGTYAVYLHSHATLMHAAVLI